MSSFYTSVHQRYDNLLVVGYEDGKRVQFKVKYSPYLFVNSGTKATGYRSIHNKLVEKIKFSDMSEARDFIRKYKDVENFPIYGLSNFPYVYIYDTYIGDVDYDPSLISVTSVDIETDSSDGFPNMEVANKEITAITIRNRGKTIVFGYNDYVVNTPDTTYVKCETEEILLTKFLKAWSFFKPDVVTGWNVEFFDIPYLYVRISRVLDEKAARSLSPWGLVEIRDVFQNDRPVKTYNILGVAVLDYLALYKKFSFKVQESYRLDYIAQVELGEGKLDYSGYDSLDHLYRANFQKFIDYNIHDVVLVDRLEEKLGLIQQVYAIAYGAKVNFVDALTSVRMWDVLIHNNLMDKGIVVEPSDSSSGDMDKQIVGGYVKEPVPGMYNWVMSLDLDGLYPHLIMQYNIGPEMLQDRNAWIAAIKKEKTRRGL